MFLLSKSQPLVSHVNHHSHGLVFWRQNGEVDCQRGGKRSYGDFWGSNGVAEAGKLGSRGDKLLGGCGETIFWEGVRYCLWFSDLLGKEGKGNPVF